MWMMSDSATCDAEIDGFEFSLGDRRFDFGGLRRDRRERQQLQVGFGVALRFGAARDEDPLVDS